MISVYIPADDWIMGGRCHVLGPPGTYRGSA